MTGWLLGNNSRAMNKMSGFPPLLPPVSGMLSIFLEKDDKMVLPQLKSLRIAEAEKNPRVLHRHDASLGPAVSIQYL